MSHPNSVASLRKVDRETRHRQILDALYMGAMTDRQIMRYLGLRDLNEVRPRITELKQAGRIREGESVVCRESGRRVRTTMLTDGRLF